jgi:biotin carboxylase
MSNAVLLAEAVVEIKQLVTKLCEQTASYDTSPEEIRETFEQIVRLGILGGYWSVGKR